MRAAGGNAGGPRPASASGDAPRAERGCGAPSLAPCPLLSPRAGGAGPRGWGWGEKRWRLHKEPLLSVPGVPFRRAAAGGARGAAAATLRPAGLVLGPAVLEGVSHGSGFR